MIRTLVFISLFLGGLANKAYSSTMYYFKCQIAYLADSSTTTYVEIDGYYIRNSSFSKPNSYLLTMDNKVEDEHFLKLIKDNYKKLKTYDYATTVPLRIGDYDREIGYVSQETSREINVDDIKSITIEDIIPSVYEGVYIESTLNPQNAFWRKQPINIYRVKGCGYAACGFTVYEYSQHQKLKSLIDKINAEQQSCWSPTKKEGTKQQLERWNGIRSEIATMNEVIVLIRYCND